MKSTHNRVHHILLLATALLFPAGDLSYGQSSHWATAYYGGWQLGNGDNAYLPVSKVDFTAMTDVVHFALVPKSDGSLDTTGNSITLAGGRALVKAAHAVGTKVLISAGGWNSEPGFLASSDAGHLVDFVKNLTMFMTSRGYDGIDVDWEPLNAQDNPQYHELIKTLRDAIGPSRLLTIAAAQGCGPVMASVQQYVDRINIMTYDLSFPSPGWVTWYNGALHQHGITFESTGGPVPACDNVVESFVIAGVPRQKIGIGVELGGAVWRGGLTRDGNGVTEPLQSWTIAPTMIPDVPYYTIIRDYYSKERYHWDPQAMASYLSIDSIGSAGDCFISYDDSSDIAAKIDYVRKEGLGGIILYELGMGYTGKGRNPLSEAVKASSLAGARRTSLPHPDAQAGRR